MKQQGSHERYRSRSVMVFLLIPLSCIVHVAYGWMFGGQHQWPVIELIVICASLIVLMRMFRSAETSRAWLLFLNVAGWLIGMGFLWWTQIYSSYPQPTFKLSIGTQIVGLVAPGNRDEPAQVADPDKVREGSSKKIKLPELQLAAPQDEEIFLDASGKSFQLTPSPAPPNKIQPSADPPIKSALVRNAKFAPFLSTSSATLLVFLRGWW